MKCFNHPKEDAVAVCRTCGKGVCRECTVIVAGDSYCKTCVETGRVKVPIVQVPTPPVEVPRPSGVPSRTPFIVGGIGAIISGVAALLSVFGSFGSVFEVYFGGRFILTIVGCIILAVGLIQAGIGYRGIRRNYGVGVGTAGFALSIVACAFLLVVAGIAIYIYYYWWYWWYWGYGYPSWLLIYLALEITCLVLFGVMQILWGVAHITSRQYTGNSGLTMATGIMLIISGALTASVIISFVGMILFFVSEILALIVFLMSKIPQQTMQTV